MLFDVLCFVIVVISMCLIIKLNYETYWRTARMLERTNLEKELYITVKELLTILGKNETVLFVYLSREDATLSFNGEGTYGLVRYGYGENNLMEGFELYRKIRNELLTEKENSALLKSTEGDVLKRLRNVCERIYRHWELS